MEAMFIMKIHHSEEVYSATRQASAITPSRCFLGNFSTRSSVLIKKFAPTIKERRKSTMGCVHPSGISSFHFPRENLSRDKSERVEAWKCRRERESRPSSCMCAKFSPYRRACSTRRASLVVVSRLYCCGTVKHFENEKNSEFRRSEKLFLLLLLAALFLAEREKSII